MFVLSLGALELERLSEPLLHLEGRSQQVLRRVGGDEEISSKNYRGIGVRWGMGLDGSEQRLCEYRCQVLLDDMNNWVADLPTPPKYLQAITEVYEIGPGDDLYANNPVMQLSGAATATAAR